MEKAKNTTAAAMQDPRYVLEILSSGGDWEKHSLCPFCRHRGKQSCLNGGAPKLGLCSSYDYNDASSDVVERQIQEYFEVNAVSGFDPFNPLNSSLL